MPVPFNPSAEVNCHHTAHKERMKQLMDTIIQNEIKLQRLKGEFECKDRNLRTLREGKQNGYICVLKSYEDVQN